MNERGGRRDLGRHRAPAEQREVNNLLFIYLLFIIIRMESIVRSRDRIPRIVSVVFFLAV